MGEAGHLQVRAADLAGEAGAFPQVTLAVGQSQRPCLGDAEVQKRDRAQVAAEGHVGVGLAGGRRGQRAHLLEYAVEVPAQPRRQQVQRRDGHPQPVLPVGRCRRGVRPDDVQVRVGLVEVELVEVGDRVHQGQPGGVLAGTGREGAQQRRHGPRLAVEGEAEGVVGEQPGRLGPVPGGLQMADGVGGVGVVGEPPRGDAGAVPVRLRARYGAAPAGADR